MKCENCTFWTQERRTGYGDGSLISTWKAPAGQGHCRELKQLFPADFGCAKFQEDTRPEHAIELSTKDGAPWQNWDMIDCPDCQGKGSTASPPDANGFVSGSACYQCVGTGKRRLYGDGYLGEERHRRHPIEALLLNFAKVRERGDETEIATVRSSSIETIMNHRYPRELAEAYMDYEVEMPRPAVGTTLKPKVRPDILSGMKGVTFTSASPLNPGG